MSENGAPASSRQASKMLVLPKKAAMEQVQLRQSAGGLIAILTLAWLVILVHDVWEFGRPSVQNAIPMFVIAIGLCITWQRWKNGRVLTRILLLLFAVINLLGAATSVLPLPLWPWVPEQSIEHYTVHLIWFIGQVPLLWWAWKQ